MKKNGKLSLAVGGGMIVSVFLLSLYAIFSISSRETEAYYRGIFAYCMRVEPQRYSLSMLNDPNTPYVRDFTPICREIAREYLKRQEAGDTVPGWEWPIPPAHK